MEHITVIGGLMVVAWKSAPQRESAAVSRPDFAELNA
jgi:transmembrane protein